jgi:hypothetical protein
MCFIKKLLFSYAKQFYKIYIGLRKVEIEAILLENREQSSAVSRRSERTISNEILIKK